MYERTSNYQLEPSNDAKALKSCLLVEGSIPRLDLELIVRKQLNCEVKRLFLPSDSAEILNANLGYHYDLILLNNVPLDRLQGLDKATLATLVIALVDQHNPLPVHSLPIHYYLPLHIVAWQFAACVKQLFKLQVILGHYPWLKMNESQGRALQLLHRSEGAVLFKLSTPPTERVIKYFKLDTERLAEHHFEVFLALVAKLQALQHRGVVPILEAQANTQGVYVVMEYVEGITLKDWLRDEPLPALKRRLIWFQEVVEAVSRLHQAGIVHGDLKSSNIMIRYDDQPVLLDFGLDGQLLREAGALAEGEIYGTPYYVSPELIMGDPLDQQADIYALGVLFYEVLMGQKPYQGRALDLILRKHMLAPIPTLPESLASYQPVLNQAMAKIPESRFATAQQFLIALQKPSLQLNE